MSRSHPRGAACRAALAALLLLPMAVWPRAAAAAGKPAATLGHDSELCRTQGDLGACYDAVRWAPRDPALLVAMGDALERANRPAEAVRAYRRAAALAPGTRGLSAKISAAEAKRAAARAAGNASAGAAVHAASLKRVSNVDPVAQSH